MKTIALFLLLFSSIAVADGQYACMTDKSSGLNWEKGSWVYSRFTPVNGILSVKGNGTRIEYKEVGDEIASQFNCYKSSDTLACNTTWGTSLVFSEKTLQGGRASLLGLISGSQSYKDSLYVSNFTCQRF